LIDYARRWKNESLQERSAKDTKESTSRNTKSELGAIATSRRVICQDRILERSYSAHFHELNLRLVAIAPSSDFV
jgi:hypothetical protein